MVWRRVAATDQPIVVRASPLQNRGVLPLDVASTGAAPDYAHSEALPSVGESSPPGLPGIAPLFAAGATSIRRALAEPLTFVSALPRFAGAAGMPSIARTHAAAGTQHLPVMSIYRDEAGPDAAPPSGPAPAATPAPAAPAGPGTPSDADLDELAERTLRKLVRMLAIEKERRGVAL